MAGKVGEVGARALIVRDVGSRLVFLVDQVGFPYGVGVPDGQLAFHLGPPLRLHRLLPVAVFGVCPNARGEPGEFGPGSPSIRFPCICSLLDLGQGQVLIGTAFPPA